MPSLTLTRTPGQQIVFTIPPSREETRIVVEVKRVVGQEVRLVSIAPDEVEVNRKEVQDRIDAGDWRCEPRRGGILR